MSLASARPGKVPVPSPALILDADQVEQLLRLKGVFSDEDRALLRSYPPADLLAQAGRFTFVFPRPSGLSVRRLADIFTLYPVIEPQNYGDQKWFNEESSLAWVRAELVLKKNLGPSSKEKQEAPDMLTTVCLILLAHEHKPKLPLESFAKIATSAKTDNDYRLAVRLYNGHLNFTANSEKSWWEIRIVETRTALVLAN